MGENKRSDEVNHGVKEEEREKRENVIKERAKAKDPTGGSKKGKQPATNLPKEGGAWKYGKRRRGFQKRKRRQTRRSAKRSAYLFENRVRGGEAREGLGTIVRKRKRTSEARKVGRGQLLKNWSWTKKKNCSSLCYH